MMKNIKHTEQKLASAPAIAAIAYVASLGDFKLSTNQKGNQPMTDLILQVFALVLFVLAIPQPALTSRWSLIAAGLACAQLAELI